MHRPRLNSGIALLLALLTFGPAFSEDALRFMDMTMPELEAAAVAVLDEGRDPKVPLNRMLSLSCQDEATANAYLESMERLVPLLATDEEVWDAKLGMARAAEYLNDHVYVDQLYGDLVAQDPNLTTAAGRSAYYNHAQALFQRGEQAEAIERYRKVWDVSARYSSEEFRTFGAQLGSAYATVGDLENAMEVLPSVLGPLDDMQNFLLTFTLANVYQEAERFGEAAKLYQRLYNFRKKLDAAEPGHPLRQERGVAFEAFDAEKLKRRWEWAEAEYEGQQHTRRAAEMAAAQTVTDDADEVVAVEPVVEAQPADVAPDPEAVATLPPGPLARYWWAWMGILVLLGLVVTFRIFR